MCYNCDSLTDTYVYEQLAQVIIWYRPQTKLSLSRVNDTQGHRSTPAFSVDSELLRYFPGHVDAFQILYGVYPVL